jgi:hypothetical protein
MGVCRTLGASVAQYQLYCAKILDRHVQVRLKGEDYLSTEMPLDLGLSSSERAEGRRQNGVPRYADALLCERKAP